MDEKTSALRDETEDQNNEMRPKIKTWKGPGKLTVFYVKCTIFDEMARFFTKRFGTFCEFKIKDFLIF